MVRARGWPRSGNVVTTPMLLRNLVVATAVRGAASEGRDAIGSTTASAKQAPATERRNLHKARRDVMGGYRPCCKTCSHRPSNRTRQCVISSYPPLEGDGRLRLSAAKDEPGWGDPSTRAPFERRHRHPTPIAHCI